MTYELDQARMDHWRVVQREDALCHASGQCQSWAVTWYAGKPHCEACRLEAEQRKERDE